MYVCWYNSYGQPTVAVPQAPAQAPVPHPLSATAAAAAPTPIPATPAPVPVPVSLPSGAHLPPPHPAEYLIPVSPQPQTILIPRKRGSEELMSHNPMVTNGTGLAQLQGEMNDAKKVKLDGAVNPPSRVVHIRSLPHEVGETDVVQLGMPFGKMTNVLVLKQKNQAFLEFSEENAAINMVSYYAANPAQVRLKPCYVQFSNHKELKTDASHAFQNTNAQAAIQAAQVVQGGSAEDGQQNTILRVIVDNVAYPVTLDVLHQLFSRFGKVLKIITFNKNNTFQALIQFSDPISATTAKVSLDSQNIYNGCNTLKIDYSKLTNLNVKYNNDKSRDFTRPDLPTGDPALDQAIQMGGPPGMVASPFAGMPGIATLSPINPAAAQGAHHFGLPGGMPMAGFGVPSPGPFGAAARLGMPLQAQAISSVILVSNLDEEKVTPEALFTLFGVYGDVHRVKILFNKKDNALIQMADPHQAGLAITFLDKVRVWGKNIRVAPSRHAMVQMPKEGQPDAGLTKDFVNSPLHRFKRPGSKNCQNIFPPSAVLHLSNIPPSITEEQLKSWFADYGTVKGFKFFQKDRKMALIQMNSVDEAILALIGLHNMQLGENSHLRVSFSKSTI